MASDATARAAEALRAYRRGAGPDDLRARDLCRRLSDAVRTSGTAGPHTTNSPAFLTLGLELVANRDPEVRALVDALAEAVAPPRSEPAGVTQTVHVTGSGNTLNLAGRDLRVGGRGPGSHPSTEPRPGSAQPGLPEPVGGAHFTVLFAAACPDDKQGLRVDREQRALHEALRRSGMRDQIRLETRLAMRAQEFAEALLVLRPRVVHFAGHGSEGSGRLLFEDEDGGSFAAPARGLRAVFAQMDGEVECVILNACYSRANSDAILAAVPYVIGMNGPMHDESAIVFTSGFYRALGEGRNVRKAYEWGCALLEMMEAEGEMPVLDTAP